MAGDAAGQRAAASGDAFSSGGEGLMCIRDRAADRRLNTEIPTCSLRTLYHTLPSLTSLSCIQGMDKKHLWPDERRCCRHPDTPPLRPDKPDNTDL